MIELGLMLPLARFALHVAARLGDGITAVMGPSGAGKTSLLEAIAGLRPARGRIAVGDEVFLDSDGGRCMRPERRRVGYVPQDAGLFPHLTALENVRFGARGPVDEVLDVLGLRDVVGRYPATLSGGERQRVAFARALATAPRVLLLDEPLAALDVGLRDRILPYLLRVRDAWRIPVVYVTHNVGEVLAVAEDVLLLEAGRVTAQGAPMTLLGSPAFVREAEAGLENIVRGRVARHDEAAGITEIETGDGLRVAATLAVGLPSGRPAVLAVRAEDVLVSTEPLRGVSARNAFAARVLGCEETGTDIVVRCAVGPGGAVWLARVTRAAVAALGLAPGRDVWVAVKSHSIRIVG